MFVYFLCTFFGNKLYGMRREGLPDDGQALADPFEPVAPQAPEDEAQQNPYAGNPYAARPNPQPYSPRSVPGVSASVPGAGSFRRFSGTGHRLGHGGPLILPRAVYMWFPAASIAMKGMRMRICMRKI